MKFFLTILSGFFGFFPCVYGEKAFEMKPFVIDSGEIIQDFERKYPERDLEYWKEKVSKIKIGMTQREVMKILGLPESGIGLSLNVSTGGARCSAFPLDKAWSLNIFYDHSGDGCDSDDKVIEVGEIYEGGWSKDYKL